MITYSQTNTLFLSPLLETKYPKFWNEFKNALIQNQMNYSFIPNTKDVWVVDFMPVQIRENKFIRFKYEPSYLTGREKKTISDTKSICEEMQINTIDSDIILEGGNITRLDDKVLISERVLVENEKLSMKKLVTQLENIFECSVIIVPVEPGDFTGHADGMIRAYKGNAVLVNDYSFHKKFEKGFHAYLSKAGLELIPVPYYGFKNKSYVSAIGCYINYLHISGCVFLPVFKLEYDNDVIKKFEQLFPNEKIIPVCCNDLSVDGGAINCVTWNIKK